MTETLMIFPNPHADSVTQHKPLPRNRPSHDRGPEGTKCKNCTHFVRHQMSKTYFKCGLVNWTRGSSTDIRANDPSCDKYMENDDEQAID